MKKPRIRHIALNVADREKSAEYYKKIFGMEESIAVRAARSIFPTAISILR